MTTTRSIKYVVITSLFLINLLKLTVQQCPEEKSSRLSILWEETPLGQCVLSTPRCVDKNVELRRRCCIDNVHRWEKEPDCESIQPSESSQCQRTEFEIDGFCYTTTLTHCPYDDVIYYVGASAGMSNITYPVIRNVTNGIDVFRWIELSHYYKLPFNQEPLLNIDDVNKNCVFTLGHDFKIVSCEENLEKPCFYETTNNYHNNLNTYCRRKMNDAYFASDYNVLSKCFFKSAVTTAPPTDTPTTVTTPHPFNPIAPPTAPPDSSYFGTAELKYPYQKHLVLDSYDNNAYSFGLKKINNTYYWIESQTKINSSDWMDDDVDRYFNDEKNIYGAVSNKGWHLVDSSLGLGKLYQYDIIVDEPSLNLVLDSDVMYLKMGNYRDLRPFMGINGNSEELYNAYCFTDAALESILYRYSGSDAVKQIAEDYYSIVPLKDAPGKYWCEGVKYATREIITSNTIYYTIDKWYGNVYVATINYVYTEEDKVLTEFFFQRVRDIFVNEIATDYAVKFKKIVGIDNASNTVKIVLQIIQNLDKVLNYEIVQQNYDALSDILEEICNSSTTNDMEIINLTNFDYCVGDVLDEANNIKLNWPYFVGKVNDVMYPSEIVITKYGKLLSVRCVQNYDFGSNWETITEEFYAEPGSNITHKLINLINDTRSPDEILHDLNDIIATNISEIAAIDVYVISEILDLILNLDNIPLNSTIEIVNSIDSIDRTILSQSQQKFNSTDRILATLDKIYIKLSTTDNKATKESNTVLYATFDLSKNNLSAVAVETIDNKYTLEIFDNQSSINFENDTFIAVMLLDVHLRTQIIKYFQHKKTPQLTVVVYINDSFFNPEQPEKASVSVIFDVLIPDFFETFISPISIIYRISKTSRNKACSYWRFYNFHPDFTTNKGDWNKESYTNSQLSLATCNFWHVTHFSLLILESPNAISQTHKQILDTITLVNCIFSGIGLFLIVLTAIIFKQWRSNKGNHILINFSIAIALQITLLYVSDFTQGQNNADVPCVIVGALLHYSVLVEFSWMLIISYLQYKRLIDIFTVRTKHIIFRSYLIGWVVPVIPVGYLLIVDHDSYLNSNTGLCYPSGIQLYITVWFPVAVVVAINAYIYCYIFYSLKQTEVKIDTQTDDLSVQIRYAVLLFIMMGLTWIFGFLSLVQYGLVFVYIFSFLSTLQGFVLFLFFIILNKTTRKMYANLIYLHRM